LLAQASSSEKLETLEDAVLGHVFKMAPRYAVFLGLHEYDGHLPDVSKQSVKSWVAEADDLRDRLGKIDTSSLGPRRKLDVLCLELLLEDALFEINELEQPAT